MFKKRRSLFIVYFLLISINLFSQGNKKVIPKLSKVSYSEKIYLQLSSTAYTTDQTIWFKAVVTHINQVPTKRSEVLHVELIDFDERIIESKLLKLNNGIADSFFDLKDELPVGRYMIRAYTRWNNNFKEDLISREYIDIYAPERIVFEDEAIRNIVITEGADKQLTLSAKLYPQVINPNHKGKLTLHIDMGGKQDSTIIKKAKDGTYNFNYVLPKDVVIAKMNLKLDSIKLKNWDLGFLNTYSKNVVINKNHLDIQFFPEGGKLIDGLTSVVGIKILDYKNEGTALSGSIVDENGVVTGSFKSNTLGMGFFALKSNINKRYYVEIDKDNGLKYKYELPKVYRKGYVLSLKTLKNDFRASICSNFSQADSLYVKVQSKGMVYYDLKLKSKDSIINIVVNRNTLPEGIATFTVLNSKREPLCERLIFNFREDNRISIRSKSNLQHYNKRDKVIINTQIKTIDSLALYPSTSLLVFNKKQLETIHDNAHNILSYLLLQSELKGNIEKPKSYFDENNVHRFYNMEALMLTQGWRNYIYQPSKENLYFKIQPEKSLSISGSVGEYFNKKIDPKKPLTLSLLTVGKEDNQIAGQVKVTTVDSTGHFNFKIADNYTSELEYLIQTTNHKGKNKDFTINIDKTITVPKVKYEKEQKLQLVDSFNVFVEENIRRKLREKSFETANGTIVLDEVQLEGYNFTPEREVMFEKHGAPDVVIEDEELNNQIDWSNSLYDILKSSYPDDVKIGLGSGGAKVVGSDFTFVFVDGIPVEYKYYDLIGSIAADEIESVEIIKNPKNARSYIFDVFDDPIKLPNGLKEASIISFMCVYSYANNGLFGIPSHTYGIYKKVLPSFAPKREFYVPKYEESNDWNEPDFRSVVFWEPNLKIDKTGEAKVEFYNSDDTGEMLVIVESISKDGEIGYYETSYTVDEKLEE